MRNRQELNHKRPFWLDGGYHRSSPPSSPCKEGRNRQQRRAKRPLWLDGHHHQVEATVKPLPPSLPRSARRSINRGTSPPCDGGCDGVSHRQRGAFNRGTPPPCAAPGSTPPSSPCWVKAHSMITWAGTVKPSHSTTLPRCAGPALSLPANKSGGHRQQLSATRLGVILVRAGCHHGARLLHRDPLGPP